ncbi:MAG: tRNA (adenosine(37)-N6)-dimethylallyltransferase MiaA [Proteobacteria bacterium]|nr:tRNA (adenosine(37)-N6)-dimethylallyltransferase MiaA [Pseudomonadota bacterium]MBU4471319.1 tRNA (adenosine(37)-N6)-dimethylallyltransferase MiaA [Pseudomonadota bacterium]MCG2751676.1 tRNA (adenosine(37)-N6)-dimethylallyltransferase MiaA [Desulfobacteraceae bacterium]
MTSLNEKPKIIVLCGPTAVGKTATAIAVAKALGGEIINADSVQIYRQMDIGTAKPTPAERQAAPHHMIDILDPDEPFDANLFAEQAHGIICGLHARGIFPIVSGGTGFYIKALCQGLFRSDPVDRTIRDRLKLEAEQKGLDHLYHRLKDVDPETAGILHPHDGYRILRALEVYEAMGIPISRYRQSHGFASEPYEVLKIGLDMDRDLLYGRIDKRVDAMLEEGLEMEVRGLLEKGYSRAMKSMQTIGYRHMVEYIGREIPGEEMIRTLKRDSRRYAKRQLTWFRKDGAVNWVKAGNLDGILSLVKASNFCR